MPKARVKLTEDERIAVIDTALSAAERELLPLLADLPVQRVVEMFGQAVETHLTPELEFIRTGRRDGCETPSVEDLRREFLELRAAGRQP